MTGPPGDGTRRTLYLGGAVYCADEPFATAMLVSDGVIAWIGSDGAARAFSDDADDVVDLGGALVTPAFVDAHVHTTAGGMVGVGLDLTRAASKAAVLNAVATAARGRKQTELIVGFGWDEREWPDPSPPTRSELDVAGGGAPVFLDRIDVHSSAVSSALVDRVPQVRERFGFTADGVLTDLAHHTARAAVSDLLPDEVRLAAQRKVRAQAAALGIGQIHEMGGPDLAGAKDLQALLHLAAAEPGPDVVAYWAEEGAFHDVPDPRVVGLAGDLFADGTFGSRTAALREPYADGAGSGHQYLTAARVRDHVIGCTEAGLQAGFHVIGDAALDTVLAGFGEAAARLGGARLRAANHRLEHVELAHPEHQRAMAEWGIVASVQPRFDEFWGGPEGMYAQRLGDRWTALNPLASMAAAGVALAFGSDAPVTPLSPWEAVRAAAFHRGPGHALSVRAAFAAHTRGGWRAAGRPGGTIAVGEPATLAMWQVDELVVQAPDRRVANWSTDPRSGTPGLPDLTPGTSAPTCLRTLVDGRPIFDSGQLP